VGHSLQSCTTDITAIDTFWDVVEGKEQRVIFVGEYPIVLRLISHLTTFNIDTPGFDDTNKSDVEILRLISEWLKTT
jgi:hypothetical protein